FRCRCCERFAPEWNAWIHRSDGLAWRLPSQTAQTRTAHKAATQAHRSIPAKGRSARQGLLWREAIDVRLRPGPGDSGSFLDSSSSRSRHFEFITSAGNEFERVAALRPG